MPIIETNGLCKRYGHTLSVHDLALRVPEGSVYGFLGPNGAGKSTTLKMILGLVRPTAGEITVFGKPMNGANRLTILQQVGSLIESPSYYGHLTGEENLRVVQTLRGLPRSDVSQVLDLVRLTGQGKKQAAHYSLGMKQRLGLAAALLGFPKLLILDEPTNGLDPAGIQEMRELIRSLPRRFGMTVVDQVGIIRSGELVFQNSLAALHQRSDPHLALKTTDNQKAGDLLTRLGLPWQAEGESLLLPPLPDERVAQLCQTLVTNHCGLLRLEERQTSLEDIFLALTGGKEGSL